MRTLSYWIAFLVAPCCALAGCGGGDGLNRVPVEGRVTQDGRPLRAGMVSFLPAEGHNGPAANGQIVDGRYQFDRINGPVAGPHRVLIRTEGGGKSAGMPSPTGSQGKPSEHLGASNDANPPIPAPAAGSWEFTVDVPPADSFERDFELK